jgi:hypothetical protein
MRLLQGIASSLTLLAMTALAQAEVCAYQDGGYCLSDIASQTTRALEGKPAQPDMAPKPGKKTISGMEGGTTYLNYYENVWDAMVEDGRATEGQREEAFARAKAAGGTKIGGYNLVVLAAGTLQHMVEMKIVTKEEAQEILNRAKKGA